MTSTDRPFTCLLMDDDANLTMALSLLVRMEGGRALVAGSIQAATQCLQTETIDVAILDNRLPDGTGYEFYSQLRQRFPEAVVVMLTGAPELTQAVELTRNGLFDYLTKPLRGEAFTECLRRARLRLERPESSGTEDLVGKAPSMVQLRDFLRSASKHLEATVLLQGETGTGKEVAARVLHRWTFGDRAARMPFVAVNCAAVPHEMFEAELFGSERGAYTGADRKREGLLEAAGEGTLFLDEIGETPLLLQAKLLRVLEAREFRSLGSTTTKPFRGRIVAATNRSLREDVKAGKFRMDLLYRLDVMGCELPPLRAHMEDLPALAESMLVQLSKRYGRPAPLLRPAELECLRRYPFPGNVRELRNLLERSLLRSAPEAPWLALDLAWLSSNPMPVGVTEGFIPTPNHLSPIDAEEFRILAQALRAERGGIRRAAARIGMSHQSVIRRLERWPELRRASGME